MSNFDQLLFHFHCIYIYIHIYNRFFVIANGLVSIHNLVMIMVDLFGTKFDYKGLRFAFIAILDMVG